MIIGDCCTEQMEEGTYENSSTVNNKMEEEKGANSTLTTNVAQPQQDDIWRSSKKHIFVLSSAGKPIFSRRGDEAELVTVFGLLQAMFSIVCDSDDRLHCIMAGNRRILYFVKSALYFVAVSSVGEPEAVLYQQLDFLYHQILFVLTSKVHDMLANNPSRDLRELLGIDTDRLLNQACEQDITSPCVAFQAISGFAVDSDLRDDLIQQMRCCIENSNAAFGLLLYEDKLVAYVTNAKVQVFVDVKDILLIAHFISNSPSLRSHDQNWVPLCLPSVNAGGYLQAYVSTLKLSGEHESVPLSLVLISASADADEFKVLHEAKLMLQGVVSKEEVSTRLINAVNSQCSAWEKFLNTVMGIHFLYKLKPSADNGSLPAQCVWSHDPENIGYSAEELWIRYFHIGCCVRVGSSDAECCLLPADAIPPPIALSGPDNLISGNRRASFTAVASDNIKLNRRQSTRSSMTESAAPSSPTAASVTTGVDSRYAAMSLPPAADHALSYAVLDSGAIVVGLATSDSELYVTFPGTVSTLDACGLANFLSASLRKEAGRMFQIS